MTLGSRHRGYLAALDDPVTVQERILAGILERNAETVFGRRNRFASIRGTEQFAREIPLSNWDDYAPFVERIRSGEQNVLTAEPVTRLVPSSGSVAARKLIPYTSALHEEFQRGIAPWIRGMFRDAPALMRGPAYWSVSPAMPEDSGTSAVPIGFDDDSAYLGWWARPLVRRILAVPSSVRHSADIDRFRLITSLFLLRAPGLRVVSIWHPSFLTLLLRFIAERWEDLLRSVRDGFVAADLPPAHGELLRRPDAFRARALAAADPARPETIWRELGQVSCWADGQAAGAARELAELFPSTPIVPKGLVATEAIVSIPFAGRHPIAVTSHYFEFLDEAGRLSGIDELREGSTYSPVITTSGGLYRYRLGDLVQVDGFVRRTPSIRFVGREDAVSDMAGEKLSDGFVARALERTFSRLRISPSFALVAPERQEGAPRYVLFVSSESPLPDTLPAELESELMANPHYAYARRLGQLAPMAVSPVRPDAHELFLTTVANRGRVIGGVKAVSLSSETGWREVFDR